VRVFELTLPPLVLEHGGVVAAHRVRGWWAGPEVPGLPDVEVVPWAVVHDTAARPAPSRGQLSSRPVVLVIHALTGDMRAGGEGGWWAPVIGPGQPLDPTTHHVLCFSLLGGCYGTSGPVDPRFPAEAVVTTRDQARSLGLALDALGVERLALVTGGSLGGMVALALAADQPARVERLAPIGAAQASSAWVLGLNHVQRQIIEAHGGSARGLELARQLAMLTYRAEAGLERTQGRGRDAQGSWRIGTYLEHQGAKLRGRFDVRAYLTLLGAMDHHALRDEEVGRISAATLAIGIDSDQLFFPEHMRALARVLPQAEYAELSSVHGHDAFLIEWDQLRACLRRAMALVPRSHT
jgi:homoserine O-acetyltransferase